MYTHRNTRDDARTLTNLPLISPSKLLLLFNYHDGKYSVPFSCWLCCGKKWDIKSDDWHRINRLLTFHSHISVINKHAVNTRSPLHDIHHGCCQVAVMDWHL